MVAVKGGERNKWREGAPTSPSYTSTVPLITVTSERVIFRPPGQRRTCSAQWPLRRGQTPGVSLHATLACSRWSNSPVTFTVGHGNPVRYERVKLDRGCISPHPPRVWIDYRLNSVGGKRQKKERKKKMGFLPKQEINASTSSLQCTLKLLRAFCAWSYPYIYIYIYIYIYNTPIQSSNLTGL